MRIVAGRAGSLPLKVPPTLARPTTDRVREAVFSSLGTAVPGSRILDLFAGSGSLGLEALSRGASSAVFVESDRRAAATISENLAKTRLEGGTVIQRDVFSYLSSAPADGFDLAFADPPYARDEESMEVLERLLSSDDLARALASGLLVLESASDRPLPAHSLWVPTKEKHYGGTRITFLRPAS